MKFNIFFANAGENGQLVCDAYDVFSKYKTYQSDAYDRKALRYYYFVLNNVVYLKII